MTEITQEYREKQLELLKLFVECCEENNIDYYLTGGTLLGAVRNNGFIPWDDDMDVQIFRKDYEKLIECLKRVLKYPFVLQAPDEMENVYWGGFMRIRNALTTCALNFEITDGPEELCNGIWLDITILDNIYDSHFKRFLHFSKLRYWKGLRMAKSFYGRYKNNWCVKNFSWVILKKIEKYYKLESVMSNLAKLEKQCVKSEYVASLALHKHLKNTKILKREWFGKGEKIQFEGIKLNVPENYKSVLEVLYGSDYMEPPTEENRNSGHFGMILDAKRSYKVYRNLLCSGRWKNNCDGKIFVLFGSGQQAQFFLEHEDEKYRPQYIFDNNKEKWGMLLDGIPIVNPQLLNELDKENVRIVIANIYWKEISAQLDEMGFNDYYSYINSAAWERK